MKQRHPQMIPTEGQNDHVLCVNRTTLTHRLYPCKIALAWGEVSANMMDQVVSEMQAVCVGRMKLANAVVVIDDVVAAALAQNSAIFSALLLSGASRVVPLSKALETCRAGKHSGEGHCVLIVATARDEDLADTRVLLEQTFGIVLCYTVLDSTGESGAVPLAMCKIPGLAQPLLLLLGTSSSCIAPVDAQARSLEVSRLAFQFGALLESLSGGNYELYAVGARPRAVATLLMESKQSAKATCSHPSWGSDDDSSVQAKTHVVIIDREADLVGATSAPSTMLGKLIWILGVGNNHGADPAFTSLACEGDESCAGQIFSGGKAASDAGKSGWERGLSALAVSMGGVDEAGGASQERLSALRRQLVKAGKGLADRDIVEMCSAAEAALGREGGVDAAESYDKTVKVLELAAEDALSDEVALQLGEVADACARKGGALRLRHILEMAVHSFGALGQRGQAEAIAAAGDESEGMMRLRAALASLVMRLETRTGGGRGRKVGSEVEELIARLVKVARRHGRGCGELAEGAGGQDSLEEYQPLVRTMMRGIAERCMTLEPYHQVQSNAGAGVAKALGGFFGGFGGKVAGAPASVPCLGEGCEALVVLVVGGVTLEEAECVRQMAASSPRCEGLKGGVLVASTGVATHDRVVRDLCAGLPIITSHLE